MNLPFLERFNLLLLVILGMSWHWLYHINYIFQLWPFGLNSYKSFYIYEHTLNHVYIYMCVYRYISLHTKIFLSPDVNIHSFLTSSMTREETASIGPFQSATAQIVTGWLDQLEARCRLGFVLVSQSIHGLTMATGGSGISGGWREAGNGLSSSLLFRLCHRRYLLTSQPLKSERFFL